ncbi:MAG: NlpC/P60 family protein [Actinomycetota bacterium]|nr:NlpC/P60 family protein [Actinomycetota bacterium]
MKKQIDDLDAKVEVAAEAYNEAYATHADLLGQIGSTKAKLKKTNKRIDQLQTMLSTRANSMYRNGPLSFVEVLLGANDFEEFAATWDLLTDINRHDADATVELKKTKAEAEIVAKELASREGEAKKVLDRMSARKRSIEGDLAQRKSMLTGLENEIAAIEAADRARAAAAAAAVSRSRSYAPERSFPAPTRAARGEVVDVAKRYLGAPYRWGASGPNSFDCSGFTMFVYSQVGVSLPHSSRAQIGHGERVSRSDLQPGDLVFFGSPIHHVGIYVGGGMYIHAPHTGDVVSIDPLSRGDYAGACRP